MIDSLQPDGCKLSVLLAFSYVRLKWVISHAFCVFLQSLAVVCIRVKVGGVFEEVNSAT